jgi:protein SCO1/2
MNRRAMSKTFPLLAAIALTLSACKGETNKAPLSEAPLAGAAIGGDFALTDKAGKTVRWTDYTGKWRIIYFGYTYCPDVCPLDVNHLMQGFAKFDKAEPALGREVQPFFVGVDTARDTPARVGEFAAAFSPRLIGLSGSEDQVRAAAKAFAVYYARGKDTPDGGYVMDHSRAAFLFDPQGKPIATLPIEQGPDQVAAELAKWVR